MSNRVTVVTCIFAPNEGLERVVLASMKATEREFPDDFRIAALDAATDGVRKQCEAGGWTVMEPTEGKPPRMGRMLKAALDICETDAFWTIEHDTEICAGTRDKVQAQLLSHPEIAGIDCLTLHPDGTIGYPSNVKMGHPKNWWGLVDYGDGLTRTTQHLSLNCTCWRTKALRDINWDRVPQFPRCDRGVSAELRRHEWTLCMTTHPCVHHFANARRCLPSMSSSRR